MRDEIFLNAVLAVGTADTTLLHTSVEALDGLEVLTVDVGLAELSSRQAFVAMFRSLVKMDEASPYSQSLAHSIA